MSWTGVFYQSFWVRTFWKYSKNIILLIILKVKKDFMLFKQRDLSLFIVKWFTVAAFHTLERYYCFVN